MNMSTLTFNARFMYSFNDTGSWIARRIEGDPKSEAFLRKTARKLDESGHGRYEREMIQRAAEEKAALNRAHEAEVKRKAAKRDAELDKITPILDPDWWRAHRNDRDVTVKGHIKPQLRWHQQLDPSIHISKGVKEDKLNRLIAACEAYHARERAGTLPPHGHDAPSLVCDGLLDDQECEELEQAELYLHL
ncbi:hypothetical protein K488DRAFT_87029 [Vararia minispora EC-137]|uniref:Uncharacterized protein n=1 Tax=Vararia minispora EC-137 TaxID=1314806 RepID=A0ACB8QHR8_9AGAM|nr:hypothetical protein K488DRAFT_87029 [Vararia minispora EC-137]